MSKRQRAGRKFLLPYTCFSLRTNSDVASMANGRSRPKRNVEVMNIPFRADLEAFRTRFLRGTLLLGFDLRLVSTFLARLSSREQRFVSAAALVLGGTLLYLLVVDPLWEAQVRLHARVAAKERELGEVITLSRTYRILRQEVDRSRPATSANVSLVAFLESLTTGTVGRDKVTGINPAGH